MQPGSLLELSGGFDKAALRFIRFAFGEELLESGAVLRRQIGAGERGKGGTVLEVDRNRIEDDAGARFAAGFKDALQVLAEILIDPLPAGCLWRHLVAKEHRHAAP